MKQQSLASQAAFEKYGRKSRRELFLDEMNHVVPWAELYALVEPHYAKAGNGRRPVGLAIMLRTYFLQQWFNLSDPGVEEALYESAALRRFVGVDLGVAPAGRDHHLPLPPSAGEALPGRGDAGGYASPKLRSAA
jgi:IS5 family transposase